MRRVNWSNPVNKNHPLNQQLRYWGLVHPGNHAGTVIRNLVSNEGRGTLAGGVTWGYGIATRPGGWGHLIFDGVDGWVGMGDQVWPSAINHSMCSWVNHTSGNDYVMARRGGGDDWRSSLDASTGAISYFRNTAGIDRQRDSGSSAYTPGIWQHICLTTDASATFAGIRIYVNGNEVASYANEQNGTLPLDTHAGSNFNWNSLDGTGEFFTGSQDDFRYYERELAAQEVLQLYEESKNGYPALLNRHHRFRGARATSPWYQYAQAA